MVSPPPAVVFEGVGKRFGSTTSLQSVSFEVPTGALFGLVGVNGAGKTTLIKCLLDANRADEGRISLFGVSSLSTRARSEVAFLPERFSAPFYATGRDFLRLMARLYGNKADETALRDAIGTLELDPSSLDKPVRAYSKGMTQKLGLAACLLSCRRLLVLDEPASGLDPKARSLFKAALKTYHRRGNTILLTSHALADVEELCDHMAVIHEGRLHFAGTPGELRARHGAATLEDAFLRCISAPTLAQSGTV